MQKKITIACLVGSLILIAHVTRIFEVVFMLLLFGTLPGTNLIVPPAIMLSLWGLFLVAALVRLFAVPNKSVHNISSNFSIHAPAIKRRITS